MGWGSGSGWGPNRSQGDPGGGPGGGQREQEELEQPEGPEGQEVRDYGYGSVTTTNYLTGDVHTRIFTGPMEGGNSPYFDVPGRGPQG